MTRYRVLAILSFIAATLAPMGLGAEAPDPVVLLKKLMTDDFDERSLAERQLEAMGESARPVLILALKSDDAEVRDSAHRLLGKLNRASLLIVAADRDGKPAAGAEGTFTRSDPSVPLEQPLPITLKADGTATLNDMTTGTANISTTWKKWFGAPGQSVTGVTQLNSGVNGIFHILTRGGTVRGKILDADGKPLKDAKLIVAGDLNADPRIIEFADFLHAGDAVQVTGIEMTEGDSDANGDAKVEGVPDGVYHCYAASAGFSSASAVNIRIREGQAVDVPEIRLKPKSVSKVSFTLLMENGKPAKSRQIFVTLEPKFDGPDGAARQARFAAVKKSMGFYGDTAGSTDEEGKYTIDNVVTGKYSLRVGMFGADEMADEVIEQTENLNDVLEFSCPDVNVTGAETALGSLKPVAGMSITGRVVTTTGRSLDGVRLVVVQEQEVTALGRMPTIVELMGSAMVTNSDKLQQESTSTAFTSAHEGTTRSAGKFEIKHVQPGRYVLACLGATGSGVIMFGVEVKEGAPTAIPEIKLEQGDETPAKTLKGRVILEDNKPGSNAQLTLFFKNGNSWGNNCDPNGLFNFTPGAGGDTTPARLTVLVPGYKIGNVDLTDAKISLTNIEVRMEKRKYGKIAVKVVDAEGRPVSGATVTAYARKLNPNLMQQVVAPELTGAVPTPRTDKGGNLLLEKQPDGPRFIHVQLPGFYAGTDPSVTVVASETVNVTVTLRRGLTISGKMEPPAETQAAPLMAFISRASVGYTQSVVAKDGNFSFSGFEPGSYWLTAAAPGLVQTIMPKVTLTEGQTQPANVTIKMVRPGAAALHVEPGHDVFRVDLAAKDSWKTFEPAATDESAPVYCSDRIDAGGRAELFGVAPGIYDAILYPDDRTSETNNDITRVTPTYIASGISMQPIKSVAELSRLKPLECESRPGSGKINGQFKFELPVYNNVYGSLHAKLVGPRCYADWYPVTSNQVQQPKVTIVGPIPQGLRVDEPNSFHIGGLPAGEYQLFAEFRWYGLRGQDVQTPEQQPKPLMTVTLKEGESLDLKAVKVEILPPDKKILEHAGEVEEVEEETPVAPDFRP